MGPPYKRGHNPSEADTIIHLIRSFYVDLMGNLPDALPAGDVCLHFRPLPWTTRTAIAKV